MHYAGISLYDPVQFGVVILTVILHRAVPITIAAAPRGPVDVYVVSGLCSLTFHGHLTHVELLFNVLDSEVTVGEGLQSTHFYAFVAPFTGLTHEYQCLYPTSRCFCLGCPPILIHHQGRYVRKHRREPRNRRPPDRSSKHACDHDLRQHARHNASLAAAYRVVAAYTWLGCRVGVPPPSRQHRDSHTDYPARRARGYYVLRARVLPPRRGSLPGSGCGARVTRVGFRLLRRAFCQQRGRADL